MLFEFLRPGVEKGGADVEMENGETIWFAPVSVPKTNRAMQRHLSHQQIVHPSGKMKAEGGGEMVEGEK